MNEKSLEKLQEAIYGRILSDIYLADVPVLLVRDGVIDSDVAKNLGVLNARKTGKTGAVILVMLPGIDLAGADAPGPQLELLPVVRVIEKPLLNRGTKGTGIFATVMALRIVRLLHQWVPWPGANMVYADKQAARPANVSDPQSIAYDVFATQSDGFDGRRLAAVSITEVDGTVTLSSRDSHAAIWYTLDASYPVPAEPSLLYSNPIPVPAGKLLTAGAYYGDSIPSNLTQHQF